MLNDIADNTEPSLAVGEFVDVLRRSTLAERRPVDDLETVAGMLTHADLVVTARAGGLLIGIARSITDFKSLDVSFRSRGGCGVSGAWRWARAHSPDARAGRPAYHADPAGRTDGAVCTIPTSE